MRATNAKLSGKKRLAIMREAQPTVFFRLSALLYAALIELDTARIL